MKTKKKRLTVEQRWEKGVPHDPRSLALAKALRDADRDIGGDGLDLRFGGDGDNGEHLLFLLDDYFDRTPDTTKAPGQLEEREALDAEKDPYPQGHGAPCYYCKDPCDKWAANPGKWPIALTHADDPGVVKWHHESCVSSRLYSDQEIQAIRAMILRLSDIEREDFIGVILKTSGHTILDDVGVVGLARKLDVRPSDGRGRVYHVSFGAPGMEPVGDGRDYGSVTGPLPKKPT